MSFYFGRKVGMISAMLFRILLLKGMSVKPVIGGK
jgi:hypothetical protein